LVDEEEMREFNSSNDQTFFKNKKLNKELKNKDNQFNSPSSGYITTLNSIELISSLEHHSIPNTSQDQLKPR